VISYGAIVLLPIEATGATRWQYLVLSKAYDLVVSVCLKGNGVYTVVVDVYNARLRIG